MPAFTLVPTHARWSQCGRLEADLRTTNRPGGCIKPLAATNKKQSKQEKARLSEVGAVIPSIKRPNEYQGHRSGNDRTIYVGSMPTLVGAAMIAVAILLSTFIIALGNRYIGIEGPTEDSAWLIDRLTGSMYRCEAPARGKASCNAEIATGSIAERHKP
jgi:hypothetical protein